MDIQLFWFTGQAGAGKSTLGNMLKDYLNHWYKDKVKTILLDGDEIRELFGNTDYSEEDRKQNAHFVIKGCELLIKNDIVPIVCMVSPFSESRQSLKEQYNCVEIYVHTTEERGKEEFHDTYYEKPVGKYIDIDTTDATVEESFKYLISKL